MRTIRFLLFLLPILFIFSVEARTQGRISGRVINRNTQEPLRGIFLSLTPGNRVTTSDSAGVFRIADLKTETYTLTVSGVGFLNRVYPNLIITSGNEIVLEIEMEPVVK
jgi:hypothetical protein